MWHLPSDTNLFRYADLIILYFRFHYTHYYGARNILFGDISSHMNVSKFRVVGFDSFGIIFFLVSFSIIIIRQTEWNQFWYEWTFKKKKTTNRLADVLAIHVYYFWIAFYLYSSIFCGYFFFFFVLLLFVVFVCSVMFVSPYSLITNLNNVTNLNDGKKKP